MMVTTKRLKFDKIWYMNSFHTTGTIEIDVDTGPTNFRRPVIDQNCVHGGRLNKQLEQKKLP